jgi:hypothetical protein
MVSKTILILAALLAIVMIVQRVIISTLVLVPMDTKLILLPVVLLANVLNVLLLIVQQLNVPMVFWLTLMVVLVVNVNQIALDIA